MSRTRGRRTANPSCCCTGSPSATPAGARWRRCSTPQGMRTYAPDQRGYSPGARPPRRRDYRLQQLVDDVIDAGRQHRSAGAPGGPRPGRQLGRLAVRDPAARGRQHVHRGVGAAPRSDPGVSPPGQVLKSWYVAAFQVPRLPEQWPPVGAVRPALRRAGMTQKEIERFRREMVEYDALPHALKWYRALPCRPAPPLRPGRGADHVLWSDGDDAVHRVADGTQPRARRRALRAPGS